MDPIHSGLITLLCSAVTGEALPLPEGFSLEDAAGLIKAQGLVPLVYAGARNCGIPKEDSFLQKLWPAYLRHTLRSERQMQAVRQLLTLFEEESIDYLPLKGCVMKHLYPAPELRVMGDADILIRMEQYERIRPLMEGLGYEMVRKGQHEYVWRKEEIVLELHRYLVSPGEKDLFSFFGTGWDRSIKEDGHRYALSAEDNWIFLFAHMTKHYRNSGIGSRHLVDLYVFRQNHPELNESYVAEAMEKLGLTAFYRNILGLLDCWFAGAPASSVSEHITAYIFSGGSFGLAENGMQTDALRSGGDQVRGSRTRSVLRKLFPTGSSFENQYPVLKKYPVLYPLLWLWRWVEVLLRRPGRIGRKLRLAAETTDEKVLARKRALEYVGLTLIPESAENDGC